MMMISPEQYSQMVKNFRKQFYTFVKYPFYAKLGNYPFLKNHQHLKRLNKYRKRVGQYKVEFDDDDMLELIILKE